MECKKDTATWEMINNIFKGDCIDIMKTISDKSIDMILCDLPYGITQNKWDIIIPFDLLWDQYNRIIKDNGAIVLTSSGIFTAQLIMSQPKLYKYKLIWKKSQATNFLNAKKQPLRKYEEICIFYKKQSTYNPQMTNGEPYNKGIQKRNKTCNYGNMSKETIGKSNGERYPIDIIKLKNANTENKTFHSTQKPVSLGSYLIKTYSNKGDIILDNAFGSGSFLVSALREGRNFIGIEKDESVEKYKETKINCMDITRRRLLDEWNLLSGENRELIINKNLIEDFIKSC